MSAPVLPRFVHSHQWGLDHRCTGCGMTALEVPHIGDCTIRKRPAVSSLPKPDTAGIDYRMVVDTKGGIITVQMEQSIDGQIRQVSSWAINTMDASVRAALIKLGWTPPHGGCP